MCKGTFGSAAPCCGAGQGICMVPAERLPSVTRRQPLDPPSTPMCDPVKLRLIEDAEDWQPRAGTSQSRSFCKLARLMGTDSMEDREDELVKKPRDAHGSSWGTGEQW
ncbi:PDZ and LIM domain protein 7-like isoform X2 [Egretta garzetta]|uniref:PDZ and LIM domain protein 7-like isoform X2 n=1 Tax=Egretta garzetta TaxID=188379 RepID=UPI00163CE44B|nr:PDZ and LIM domain protein 7-like isoform X2 [Egretta garzetta]